MGFVPIDTGFTGYPTTALLLRLCFARKLPTQENIVNRLITSAGVMLSLVIGTASFAQDSAKQDMKDAGHETKQAAKDVGSATKKTAKKAGHKVKKGAHKAAQKTKEGAQKVEDKTTSH
jgi:hypothetical protein